MKMICIDDETDILQFGSGEKELTRGKEYEVLHKYYELDGEMRSPIQIIVMNDRGRKGDYLLSRFATIEEWREMKLNELGI
jgi:hypothetical protein